MAKFRKKPMVIDAWLFEPSDPVCITLLEGLGGRLTCIPDGLRNDPTVVRFERDGVAYTYGLNTLEGTMIVRTGDWIIRGVAGEVYPCKPEIFAATYEAV